MKRFIALMLLLGISIWGYSQNITMVTYHPSKYGNYEILNTTGETILASETSDSDVLISNTLTVPNDVSVVQFDTTTITSVFFVGNTSKPNDIAVSENVTFKDDVDISGNLTANTSVSGGTFNTGDITSDGAADVTGTLSVGDDLRLVGVVAAEVDNATFSSGSFAQPVIDTFQVKNGGTYWTLSDSGLTRPLDLSWSTIEYAEQGTTTTTQLTLLIAN